MACESVLLLVKVPVHVCDKSTSNNKPLSHIARIYKSRKWQIQNWINLGPRKQLWVSWSAGSDSQHGGPSWHPKILGSDTQRPKQPWIWETSKEELDVGIQQKKMSSSSLLTCCAARTNLPDPLSPPVSRSSFQGGFPGYILYRHRAVVYRFGLVVLPLLVHVKWSTGVYRLCDIYNKKVISYYFKNNPTQRGFRKLMMEIWTGSTKSNKTSQKVSEEARLILKKGWLSDWNIREICGQVNHEQYTQRELPK